MSIVRKLVGAVSGAAMLAGTALGAAPAKATPWEYTSRGWEIDITERGTCTAFRRYEDGTYFMLGWQLKAQAFAISFGRDAWAKKITQDENYDVSFETDGKNWSGGTFRGKISDTGTHGSLHSNGTLTTEFMVAFARASGVRFKINGKVVLSLQLDGSYEALAKTLACQKAQGERTSEPSPTAPTAPADAPTVPRVSRF